MKKILLSSLLLVGFAGAVEWHEPLNINPTVDEFKEMSMNQQDAICHYYVSWAIYNDKAETIMTNLTKRDAATLAGHAMGCSTAISRYEDNDDKAFNAFLKNWSYFK